MLLRLPRRAGFGPSTFGVNRPVFASICPDELHVVVVVGRGVFLERPVAGDEAEVDVVGRVGLAVGAVVERARLELRQRLRET